MEVRKKRPRGVKKEAQGFKKVSPLNPLSVLPRTFRKLECWPANESPGRSSALAEERTASGSASPGAITQ
jgi:hypothetical protein